MPIIFEGATISGGISIEPYIPPAGIRAIFGYGNDNTYTNVSMTNLVSNTGVVSNDVTGVGTARQNLAAAGYGTDKAIFGYGLTGGTYYSLTNLVSNEGVVATNTAGVGTLRAYLAAATYGTDKAIFGYGTVDGGATVSITTKYQTQGLLPPILLGLALHGHNLQPLVMALIKLYLDMEEM